MNYDFVLESRYDKTAYQALSEASWQLFRKPSLQTRAYPILSALAILMVISLFLSHDTTTKTICVVFLVFVVVAFPLSAVNAKRKMCATAIKDAQTRNEYPTDIQFVFSEKTIVSTVKGVATTAYYSQLDGFATLGDWRFLFFGQAAYIFHRSSFQDDAEFQRFETFIQEKCGCPVLRLKGNGPTR